MNKTSMIHHFLSYPLGGVAVNVVLQIVVVLLFGIMFCHLGLLLSVGISVGYVGLVLLVHFSLSPYYNKRRHEDSRQEMLHSLRSHSLRAVVLTMLLVCVSQSLRCATLGLYFFDYVNSQTLMSWFGSWSDAVTQENVFTIGLIAFVAVGIVSQLVGAILFTQYVSLRFGKKETVTFCLVLTALFSLMAYMPQPDEIGLFCILCVLKSFAFGAVVPLLWVMTGDVADQISHQHRVRATGFCYSGVTFALKAGLGLGGALGGLLLIAFGYLTETDGVQSWTTVQGIRFITNVAPALLFTLAIVALRPYSFYNTTFQPPRAT